jgi:putative DNA primase/helicase
MPASNIRSIAAALGGKAKGRNRVLCPGPGHSRNDRSLKVIFRDDGTFSVTSFANDDWQSCKDYVRERLGMPNDWRVGKEPANDSQPAIHLREQDDDDLPGRIRSALKRWDASGPVAGTLAETYLASRKLFYSGKALRFRPNDRSIVALMTDAVTAEPCGVHVTYLDAEGSKTGRKMYGKAKGAVVRLSPGEDVHYGLAIGEGIETCMAAPFRPIWACLSAGGIRDFPVLSGITALTIFADNDASGTGLAAAKACAERWHAADREVFITIPNETGVDFATIKEVA